jgi:mRNA interferase MazF
LKRGEVWWVCLDPTVDGEIRKIRPAVVLSVDALNRARKTVVVVPLSTSAQPRPPIVVATPSSGPSSVAVCDQVRAVDKTRLVSQIGVLSPADMRAVGLGVKQVLGLL